ncbi:MAG: hypothetical protein ACYTHJ_01370 [Planctomycetota bacterium]|jgi:hypothetical protein
MGFITNRIEVVATFVHEYLRFGIAQSASPSPNGEAEEAGNGDVVFVLDGVGGFQFAPLLVRRVLREQKIPLTTRMYRWQGGLVGEILTDLMWHRRNRMMGLQFARDLLAYRRQHPDATMHILAYSGGAGIAVFACEKLKQRPIIETLILACPALSPSYNLGPALHNVKRAYALTSHRDRYLLGIGTKIFGTTDRVYTAAAGMQRFIVPDNISDHDAAAYHRMREICWSPQLKSSKHHGGHTGWLMPPLLKDHLVPLLNGKPRLHTTPVRPLQPLVAVASVGSNR